MVTTRFKAFVAWLILAIVVATCNITLFVAAFFVIRRVFWGY